jgi:magnesium-transporting ATPase (P-type)
VGKGAREGILIKDAATLEKLHEVNTLVMDKTGTITKGMPEVVSLINTSHLSETEVLTILASLESRSEHPLARAIIAYASAHGVRATTPTDFEVIKGKGVRGTVDGVVYLAGNEALMRDEQVAYNAANIEREASTGKTPIMLASNGTLVATIMVADAIKPEAKAAVADLKKIGITVVMLTGDNAHTARAIAHEAGISEVIAEVLPADKRAVIQKLQSKSKIVGMVGDGINDAPALAQADVGIAMATGTDVAIESAGITLLHGDVSKLVKAVRLSKITMTGIRQNLFWAFIYNLIGIPLAAGAFYPLFGWTLNPIFAGLAMGLSSVSVVSNSLRIKSKSLESTKSSRRANDFVLAIPAAFLFLGLFALLQKFGLVNLIGGSNTGYSTAFIVGIVASLSTCMAVVGGLVLSLSASYSQKGVGAVPLIIFHAARLAGFFILGGVIGALGGMVTLSGTVSLVLSIIVGTVMLILGINLLGIFRHVRRIQPRLPKAFGSFVESSTNAHQAIAPILAGVATFFLPCGFTQSMQLYALSTGHFMTGALTMLVFALGTLPALALLSAGSWSINKSRHAGVFFKAAGIVVIAFALFNVANALAGAGIINPLINL